MARGKIRFALLFIPLLSAASLTRAESSQLWGNSGEAWFPTSRLPDFSYAGYQAGRMPIPDVPQVANVKDYGAKGDGKADDTEAFLSAIEAAGKGALFIPAGRYKITQVLRVMRRGIVLRGEGPDKTFLFFPLPLREAVGDGENASPSGSWSWDGGFIWFEGTNRGQPVADVTASVRRGATSFKVDSTERFHPGQKIRLLMYETDGSLGKHLHDDRERGSRLLHNKLLVDFSCTVVKAGEGRVIIDRPVRTDVRPQWRASFETDAPTTEDVGIENLTIQFPLTHYAGHHDEPGFNAITFQSVSNGWVRNVNIVNADSGIIFRNSSKFCTVDNVEMRAEEGRTRGGWDGHHGFELANLSQDNLITNFRMPAKIMHSISVTSMACGNVFMKGSGTDLHFDHHRKAPYENLYTEIDAGKGSDLWLSGGDLEAGPYSGARETFWNIKIDRPQSFPEYAIDWNVIGMTTNMTSVRRPEGNWVEAIDLPALTPANLFESQRARLDARRNAPKKP